MGLVAFLFRLRSYQSLLIPIIMKCSEYNYYVSTDKGDLIYNTIGDSFVFLPLGQSKKLKEHDWNFFTGDQISSFRKANIVIDKEWMRELSL